MFPLSCGGCVVLRWFRRPAANGVRETPQADVKGQIAYMDQRGVVRPVDATVAQCTESAPMPMQAGSAPRLLQSPRQFPLNVYMYMVPDQDAQRQLVALGCHPRARKGDTEYGGLHLSIKVQHGCTYRGDRNMWTINSEADWVEKLERLCADADKISQSEWRDFLCGPAVFYDFANRDICDGVTRVRGIEFQGQNPMHARGVYVRNHFSLYGTHHRQGRIGVLDQKNAEQVLGVLRDERTRWCLVLSVEAAESSNGCAATYSFCWDTARELRDGAEQLVDKT